MTLTIEQIAELCHEANKSICEASGDNSQRQWDDAAEWQQKSAIDGVRFRIDNPDATAEEQHNAWCKAKLNDGWQYGKKDADAKTHPYLVTYDLLPFAQRVKDHVFAAIVMAATR